MSEEKKEEIIEREIPECVNYNFNDIFEMEDLGTRRLYLNANVDSDTLQTIGYHILRYNRMDKDTPAKERTPIILYINSWGGSTVDGMGLADIITLSETDVYTVNLAACYSMGFYIFLAGKRRYAMPHSQFLLHEGYVGSVYGENTSKARERIEFETVKMEEENRKYILDRTNIGKKVYDKNFKTEWYMLPQEAKKLGIVDCIIGEDCKLSEIL